MIQDSLIHENVYEDVMEEYANAVWHPSTYESRYSDYIDRYGRTCVLNHNWGWLKYFGYTNSWNNLQSITFTDASPLTGLG